MILVKEMPTSGQFIAVWKFKGHIWSDTYKWGDGILYEWSDRNTEWVVGDIEHLYRLQDAGFVVE